MTGQQRYDAACKAQCSLCAEEETYFPNQHRHLLEPYSEANYQPCTAPTLLEWAGELAEALEKAQEDRDAFSAQCDSLVGAEMRTADAERQCAILTEALENAERERDAIERVIGCLEHVPEERMARYVRESRKRLHPPLTAKQRSENARKASEARWNNERWKDPQARREFTARISGRKISGAIE